MAGRGKSKLFHGSYTNKADAERKESRRPGSYILKQQVRCAGSGSRRKLCTRWLVVTDK
ncbi:MAG TPA: hypothetical protein VKP61_15135 [Candidatus Acidoferrum sp.]|nr:hypothetical protein [Candidatus Acidoferrum sp.]